MAAQFAPAATSYPLQLLQIAGSASAVVPPKRTLGQQSLESCTLLPGDVQNLSRRPDCPIAQRSVPDCPGPRQYHLASANPLYESYRISRTWPADAGYFLGFHA